jgi:hypothetical protein
MSTKYLEDGERAERVALLIAMEIARIVDDLELRQAFLLDVWGRHRDRGPFLDTVASRWSTLGFPELVLLPADALAKVEEFYRELEEFRLYLRYTEDMPTTMSESYSGQLRRLNGYAEQAVEALGGTPERPLLDFPDLPPEPPPMQVMSQRPLLRLAHFMDGGAPPADGEDEPG